MVSVKEWLQAQQPELARVLAPQGMDAERFWRIVYTACLRQPRLAECSRESLMLSVMESAALGLEIDSVSGLAYLIPYGQEAKLIVGYRGYAQLALRHPKVTGAGSVAVFEGDEFTYREGDQPRLDHTPKRGNPGTWDVLIGCYARHQVNGARRWISTFMYREEIEDRRERSQAWKSGKADTPWRTDAVAMGRKTAWREHTKYVPQSAQLMRALAVESDPEMERPMGEPPVPHGTTTGEILDAISNSEERKGEEPPQ
jgi:recombination protein RecT